MKAWTRSVPMLAGLAVVGTVAGVSLGHSAISEINPVYYSEAATRFHGDQVPQRPDWTLPPPALSDASVVQGLGTGCFGCSGASAEYHAAPAVTTYTDSWRADAARAAAPIEVEFAAAPPDPERKRVVRYASYPITEAEAAPEPAAPEEDTAAEFATE